MIIITIMMVLGMIASMLTLVNLVVERKRLKPKQHTPHIKKKYPGTLEYRPTYEETNSPMPVTKKLSDRMILDVFGTSLYELVMQIEKEVEEEENPKPKVEEKKVEVPEPEALTLQPVIDSCDHSQFIVEGSSSYKSRVTCFDCGIEMFEGSSNKYASAIAYSKRQIASVISVPNAGYISAGNSLKMSRANGL